MSEFDSDLILFADETLLAVNKPANASIIHDSHRPDEISFVDHMRAGFGPLWVVHRLDRETSGALLFARTQAAHRALNQQFQERRTIKMYHLIACGNFTWKSMLVDLPLVTDGDRRHHTIIDMVKGKPAQTEFTILDECGGGLFLIQAEPKTGYTHQIRTHLSSLNGSIVWDRLYKPHPFPPTGEKPFELSDCGSLSKQYLPINRLALHACSVTFDHPENGQLTTITAPYPDDFRETLKILKTKGQT